MAPTLRFGSHGFEVAKLQLELNLKKALIPLLVVDGIFGPLTQKAVMALQRRSGLVVDGVVGPQTHAAAESGLTLTAVDHKLTNLPQPTPTTCWAASTASVTHSSVAAVIAKTPIDMIDTDGSLKHYSSSDQGLEEGRRFGRAHGLRCFPPVTWTVSGILDLLGKSPLIVDMLWNSSDYAEGKGSPGHMVSISAVVSDNDPSGERTYLQILNPLPRNVGKISWEEYSWWIQMLPTRTYRTFSR